MQAIRTSEALTGKTPKLISVSRFRNHRLAHGKVPLMNRPIAWRIRNRPEVRQSGKQKNSCRSRLRSCLITKRTLPKSRGQRRSRCYSRRSRRFSPKSKSTKIGRWPGRVWLPITKSLITWRAQEIKKRKKESSSRFSSRSKSRSLRLPSTIGASCFQTKCTMKKKS